MTAMPAPSLQTLAEADLLLLLALLLAPPRGVEDDALATDEELTELARRAGFAEPAVGEALRRAVAERAALAGDRLAAEHARLFEGGQPCPPNETAYIRRDKGVILADIRGFYEAFGMKPAERTGEKPDHVSTELEFVALLLVMLEQAEQDGSPERAQVTGEALHAFAGDHIGEWLPLFCERLAQTDPEGHYGRIGRLLERAWSALVARHDLPVADADASPPDDEPGSPYECGLCDA